jgi:phage-related minor tail protein
VDELETLAVRVRADREGFAREVAALRGELETGLGAGAERAGRLLEGALVRALRTGKLGFEDLKRTALAAMAQIAAAALRSGIGAVLGGGGAPVGGIGTMLAGLIGAPGRATGGETVRGRPYLVGERGPELFVPAAHGRIEPLRAARGAQGVHVHISIAAPPGAEPQALRQSSRQIARAVKAALVRTEE